MKLSQLIQNLTHLLAEEGDIPVLISSDPEGNSYNDLGKQLQVDVTNTRRGKLALIFPVNQVSPESLDILP